MKLQLALFELIRATEALNLGSQVCLTICIVAVVAFCILYIVFSN